MEAGATNGGSARWLEREVARLDQEKASKEFVGTLVTDIVEVKDDLKGVKKALWSIAIGLPVSGIMFLAGVQQLVHH